jgi:hypothetical protein
MQDSSDVYTVRSPWGAIAAFFMVQCFGFVTLQGFRLFVNIGVRGADEIDTVFTVQGWSDRIFMPAWGLAWIFIFVVFQGFILHRIAKYLRNEGVSALFGSLKRPSESVKLVLAVLFAVEYVRFLLRYYPFPSRPISFWMSLAFGLFSWGISALIVWLITKAKIEVTPDRNQVGTVGKIIGILFGFLVGAAPFVVAVYVWPGAFYFLGMVGLFFIMTCACQLLFLSTGKKRT